MCVCVCARVRLLWECVCACFCVRVCAHVSVSVCKAVIVKSYEWERGLALGLDKSPLSKVLIDEHDKFERRVHSSDTFVVAHSSVHEVVPPLLVKWGDAERRSASARCVCVSPFQLHGAVVPPMLVEGVALSEASRVSKQAARHFP